MHSDQPRAPQHLGAPPVEYRKLKLQLVIAKQKT